MNFWLDLFTPYTWERFRDSGGGVSGFRPRQRRAATERVKKGDLFLCYLVKVSRWCGYLEVTSDAFEDHTPIFAERDDPFPIRFKVRPRVILDFEQSIPVEEPRLWNELSFTKSLKAGSRGWAQLARLRQSLVSIPQADGELIRQLLDEQSRQKKVFPLSAVDARHVANRTVVRTERGEVEVEVPEREDEEHEEHELGAPGGHEAVVRVSHRMQAKVAKLGAILGFTIWIPPSDRAKVSAAIAPQLRDQLVATLPLNYDTATLKTIENIDVIWLDRRSIARAFEIEHTTAIYSGLLRMADLLAMQPRMNIRLHIVAPTDRREQVRREIIRPVFSVLEGGAMAGRCSFLSYDAIDEIGAQPNLSHMRETILEDFEEFFDLV